MAGGKTMKNRVKSAAKQVTSIIGVELAGKNRKRVDLDGIDADLDEFPKNATLSSSNESLLQSTNNTSPKRAGRENYKLDNMSALLPTIIDDKLNSLLSSREMKAIGLQKLRNSNSSPVPV